MGHVELVSHKVEAIRQKVNGPITSKDTFAVHGDLMKRLVEAGLGSGPYLSIDLTLKPYA